MKLKQLASQLEDVYETVGFYLYPMAQVSSIKDHLIDFNVMSTHQVLFHAMTLGNCVPFKQILKTRIE